MHIRDEILAELVHCHAVGYSVSDTAARVANLAAQMQRDKLEEAASAVDDLAEWPSRVVKPAMAAEIVRSFK